MVLQCYSNQTPTTHDSRAVVFCYVQMICLLPKPVVVVCVALVTSQTFIFLFLNTVQCIRLFWGRGQRDHIIPLCHCTLTFSLNLFSGKDPADLQHWDEKQDEGSHNDRWRDLLEVDLPEHRCPGHRQCSLPLEHGGWLSANQSFWPSLQSGRLPDHQLPDWRQTEVVAAHWYFSTGN